MNIYKEKGYPIENVSGKKVFSGGITSCISVVYQWIISGLLLLSTDITM